MSGLASLLFATALTFGWVKPEVANNPNAWWSIAGTCLLYALFLSWQDEHHLVETLRAEKTAPRLILKYMTDIHRYWQIANTGDDAFNVTSEPIIGAKHTATIPHIPHIPSEGEERTQFVLRSPDYPEIGDIVTDHLGSIFDSLSNGESQIPTIKILLLYNGASGQQFESSFSVTWDGSIVSKPLIVHDYIRVRRPSRVQYRRVKTWFAKFMRRLQT
jgi:hypothetical protein